MISDWCRDLIDVETSTVGRAQGARTKAWSIKYIGLAVRLQPLSAQLQARFKRDSMEITHKAYVVDPGGGNVSGISITQGERLRFPSQTINVSVGQSVAATGGPGTLFQVKGVRNPDELNQFLVLDLVQLAP